MFMIVILGQMLVIASLSTWIYEEYVSNLYLREYVSNFLTAEGWILGVTAVAAALGSLTILFLKRPVKSVEPVETVSTETTIPVLLPRVAVEAREKPGAGFHPAVAALLADISGRRSASAATPVPRIESPETLLTFKEGTEESQMTGPTTDLYPAATSPRMVQPFSFVPQPAVPIAKTSEADRSAVVEPTTHVSPSLPRNVTTVITGIIPVQKKREPESSEKENPSS